MDAALSDHKKLHKTLKSMLKESQPVSWDMHWDAHKPATAPAGTSLPVMFGSPDGDHREAPLGDLRDIESSRWPRGGP